jgi:hypothetical protein
MKRLLLILGMMVASGAMYAAEDTVTVHAGPGGVRVVSTSNEELYSSVQQSLQQRTRQAAIDFGKGLAMGTGLTVVGGCILAYKKAFAQEPVKTIVQTLQDTAEKAVEAGAEVVNGLQGATPPAIEKGVQGFLKNVSNNFSAWYGSLGFGMAGAGNVLGLAAPVLSYAEIIKNKSFIAGFLVAPVVATVAYYKGVI